jgi:hypothetical protein
MVRIRGVLPALVLLLVVAGCARESEATPPAAAPPAWTEPASYKFSFESTCGERPLLGTFRATVENGTVTTTEGLDDQGRRALMLRIADLVPSLGTMVSNAGEAKARGATVTIEHDPTDGHPISIMVDDPKAIDEEECYRILDYSPGA